MFAHSGSSRFARQWAPAARRRGRSRRWVGRPWKILGIAAVVAAASFACLLAVSWIRSQAAVRVVQEQVSAIRGGNVEEAYSLFSREYQSGVTLARFRRWLRRQGHLTSAQKLHFWGRSVWGGTALLLGSFQDELGHDYPVRYVLVRENGSWRIDGFSLSAAIPDTSAEDDIHLLQV